MNSLSWLLYWADVLPTVAHTVTVISALALIISVIILVLGITGFFGDEAKGLKQPDEYYSRRDYLYAINLAPRFRKAWMFVALFFVTLSASLLVPSKETFYMIAASQAGEQAMQTPEFSKARAVINKFLDDQLKNEEPKAVNEENK